MSTADQERIPESYIDFGKLEANVDALAARYCNAVPFQHVVIDGFLRKRALEALDTKNLMRSPASNELSSDLVFAKNKIESPRIEEISSELAKLREELLSNRFQAIIQAITGIEVFLDETFTGGGLHQGGRGSYLEMHADFTRHPVEMNWIRELNLLLYLNHDHEEAWGGNLNLTNSQNGESASIRPIENRLVIMLTKEHTLHGYRAIQFPAGVYRTSIAAYAYSLDDGSNSVTYRSTTWKPETMTKSVLASFLNPLVSIKQKLFGSRTAQRATRNPK